ncbi:hypothetical protein [Bordetella petrii]|uniref:hypothetical protein n=1 Tax=Bordetella petrii TaxID=94624 RepID=UPI001E531EEC|nr:hypothetical protein [Bordetella petrii]MCD0503359.1 hypothetical protein [Bordetella petrii]
MRSVLPIILVAAASLGTAPAKSQESLPAVDGLSGKLGASGSTADGNTSVGVEGAITFPLGHRFGMQLDLGAGRIETSQDGNSGYQGAGAHFFWRDPSKGMIGIEAGYAHVDAYGGVDTYTVGVEAERYWDKLTLAGVMGMADGGHATVSTSQGRFRHDVEREFVAGPRLTWYPDDNLALSASGSVAGGDYAAGLGAEFGLASESSYQPSLFARAIMNEGGEVYAMAGINIYFGQRSKSLIRRHREDDPPIAHLGSQGHLAGIAYWLGAVRKFKQHKDNPTVIPPGG